MKYYILVFVCLFTFPLFTYAGPVIRSGETVSIDTTQVIQGDFYALGGVVSVSGKSEEDAYLLGGTVTVNAPVVGDLGIVGGTAQIHSEVGDDLRVVGGDITLASTVQGDVLVLGGKLNVLSTASIEGDLIVMAGELNIEGAVKGTIHGTVERARIDSRVGGTVSLIAGTGLTLGERASIGGDVLYESTRDLVRAQNAEVKGVVQKRLMVKDDTRESLKSLLITCGVILFTAFSLYFVFRRRMQSIFEMTLRSFGISGLVGLGTIIVLPFVSALLFVSVLGSLLGVVLLLGYLLLLITAFVLSGITVGCSIEMLLTKRIKVRPSVIFFGTLVFLGLSIVPLIGGMFAFAYFAITLGGIVTALYRTIIDA